MRITVVGVYLEYVLWTNVKRFRTSSIIRRARILYNYTSMDV